ncbi:MAG: amino acid permease [Bacteroidetes bacterium]|nr:amino acid permease [Bacteroidota bacterium]
MPKLDKKLTLYGLTMIAIGSCIGSGIFATPNGVVQEVPHHGYALLVWVLGGLIALTGALTFAELGGMFPKAGGVYVFLKEAYGGLVGFLYGWVTLLVVSTGALAALSVIFADYMKFFIPNMTETGRTLLAICTIVGLTGINIIGVQVSQWLSNIFTGLKLLALAGIIVVGFIYYQPQEVEVQLSLTQNVPDNLGGAMLAALIGVLFSVGGWHHASYVAGEAIDAPRTVPRAMVFGALIVTVTYVLANLAYMFLLPLPQMADSTAVAGDALAAITPAGGKIAAVIIAVSIFGTIAIYTMSSPRIYFAMARDGIFFKQLAFVHPRFHTPVNAMVIQAVWAVVLLLFWGTFINLITYVTFTDIVFMTLAGMGIFIFRKKRPDTHRPYKTIAYPIVPLIFILISSAFIVNTLIERPQQAWAGLGFVAVGIFVFQGFKRANK